MYMRSLIFSHAFEAISPQKVSSVVLASFHTVHMFCREKDLMSDVLPTTHLCANKQRITNPSRADRNNAEILYLFIAAPQ